MRKREGTPVVESLLQVNVTYEPWRRLMVKDSLESTDTEWIDSQGEEGDKRGTGSDQNQDETDKEMS